MDTYENKELNGTAETNDTPEIPETEETAPCQPFADSPFADSPYVIAEAPRKPEPVKKAKKKKRKEQKVLKTVLSAVLIVALVAACCGATGMALNRYWSDKNAENTALINQLSQQVAALAQEVASNSYTGNGNSISGTPNTGTDGGLTPGQVYTQNVKSVVAISNQITTNIYGQISTSSSSGSGFVLTEDGYIVSNYHVVENATTLTVTLWDNTQHEAQMIGGDEDNDIALLKIDAAGLRPVTLGSSDNLIVGDQVVAIGNPMGELTNTLTVGYISAKDREISTDGTYINMLQTDAAINPGNSGGPLFNMKGEVIGITTAKYSGTTSSGATIEGIGFAIPIDDISGMLEEIMNTGYVSRPYLGITVNTSADGVGAYVYTVDSNGAAAASGIKAGDIIVAIGDAEVDSVDGLTRALRNFKAGQTTTVSVYRSRQVLTLRITLGEKPVSTSSETESSAPDSGSGQLPSEGDYSAWWDYFFGNE